MHRQVAGMLTSKRTKWISLAFWVLVLVAASQYAQKLTDAQQNDAISWLPGDAESTKALKEQAAFLSPDTLMTAIVYERPGGLADGDLAKVTADAEEISAMEEVKSDVMGPLVSEDGEAIQLVVPLDLGADGWELAGDSVKDIRAISEGGADGLEVYVTGPGGMAADGSEIFKNIDTTLLLGTLAVVIVLLLLTYRSPVLWILPLASAVVALTFSQAVIYLLAEHADLVVNAQSASILTVLVLGSSTDYALLLVARYREELRRHHDRHEAMAVALHRAGPAIFASAATVVLGMLCLLFAVTNSTQGLGPVLAIGVSAGLLAMLTLLPALLVICGRWVFWPRRPAEGSVEPTEHGVWARMGEWISVRPRRVWVVTAGILAAASIGVVQLDATGLANDEQYTKTVDSVTGEKVLAEHFPAGSGTPVVVMTSADAADAVADAVAADEGIESVSPPVVGEDTAYIEATLADAPDSQAAYDTINRLRGDLDSVDDAALVGGQTAINMDVQDAAARDNKVIIPIVLLVVFLILALLLRAVVAPLILMATVVLSFGAALGISALVFQYVFGFEGADSAFPLFVFVFLVALGIDYNIFLMTRVREEAIKYGTRRGALIGLAATGGVITSAGMVLAGTFAVLGTLPMVFVAELGFAVAFGVLLDTIIVRSVLVTALNLDLGRTMWWPSELGRKHDVDPDEFREEERVLVG